MKPDKALVYEKQAAGVAPNKPVLAVLVIIATVVGLGPYALYVGRYQVAILAVTFVVATIASVWQLRGFSTRATEAPSLGELVLAGWSALFGPATLSLFGLLALELARGVKWLVLLIAGWLGADWRPDAGFDPLWASLAAVSFLGVGFVSVVIEELPRKLYPDSAGARSPFFSLLVEKRRLTVMVVGALLVLAVIVWAFPPPGKMFAFAMTLFLMYTGASLDNLGSRSARTADKQRVIEALRKLLEATGYEAVASPRTGKSEIDPLISTVDLLAHSPEQALVIEIKCAKKGDLPAVEWHEASRLRNAAQVLREELWEPQATGDAAGPDESGQLEWPVEVCPLLILVDGRPRSESLDRYLRDEPMDVAEITELSLIDEIEGLDPESGGDRLRAIAEEHLGIDRVTGYPPAEPPAEETA